MEELEYSVLKVLVYFDIFHYPLLDNEIAYFLDRETTPEELSAAVTHLTKNKIIYHLDGFYTLRNDASLIDKRIDENKRAALLLPKARMVCNLLFYFPFVRAIAISGSLSKNVADEQADFDYFIITKTNRLWVARTILSLWRKCSAIVGKQDWFCLNYFIDESCLLIPEQNIYTATEIVTLIYTRPSSTCQLFLDANSWVNRFYPHFRHKRPVLQEPAPPNRVKKAVESLFNLAFVNKLDTWLMRQTIKQLQKKKEAGKLVFRGKELLVPLWDKHYCKHDPACFQDHVLQAYAEKLNHLLQKIQVPEPLTKPSFAGQ